MLSTVTLYSNGVVEAIDDNGRQTLKTPDRFCNVWAEIYSTFRKEREEGSVCFFFIGDFYGGRVPTEAFELEKFYQEQLLGI
jgi:hypothetical protein